MVGMRKIEWSLEASSNLDSIVDYLEKKWTEKELQTFRNRLKKQLSLIAESPELYKLSSRRQGLRECQITRHNTLFYKHDDDSLYIVAIFDNRQNPDKLGFLI